MFKNHLYVIDANKVNQLENVRGVNGTFFQNTVVGEGKGQKNENCLPPFLYVRAIYFFVSISDEKLEISPKLKD